MNIGNSQLTLGKIGGCDFNLVASYLHRGLSIEEAFGKCEELLRKRFRDWYLAQAELPLWGQELDAKVQKYIQGVQNVVAANLNWR